jgi:hypothetical protein
MEDTDAATSKIERLPYDLREWKNSATTIRQYKTTSEKVNTEHTF